MQGEGAVAANVDAIGLDVGFAITEVIEAGQGFADLLVAAFIVNGGDADVFLVIIVVNGK